MKQENTTMTESRREKAWSHNNDDNRRDFRYGTIKEIYNASPDHWRRGRHFAHMKGGIQ